MASIPYFILSPTGLLALISLWKGPDETIPTPNDKWKDAVLDVVIPARNEGENIAFCLSTLEQQTFPIRKVTIFDDASTDDTVLHAEEYLKDSALNVEIVKRDVPEGKTPSMYAASQSDSDALMILDADTFLFNKNYIETLVFELYQNAGVASVSGTVYPLHEKDFRDYVKETPKLAKFYEKFPEANYIKNRSWIRRFARCITNVYRDIIYLFLEGFIYKGELEFSGSIPNTIGCAAIHDRKRLNAVFEEYIPKLGFNFTDAEDTFIGFSYIDNGFRNAVVRHAIARTIEPELQKLPKQVFIWSSGFFQSCYYFRQILTTSYKQLKKAAKVDPGIEEQRKIKEQYRQSWGKEHTLKSGRPIGLYVFTTTLEKLLFPAFLIFCIATGNITALLLTLFAESFLVSLVVGTVTKHGSKIKNMIKTFLIAPVRYFMFIWDVVVLLKFIKDILFNTKDSWIK